MTRKTKNSFLNDDRSLVKRYLFWLYKTTKDELDRIDRKFTQLEVDRGMQRFFRSRRKEALGPFIKEWDRYVADKERGAKKLKFDDSGGLLESYVFLRVKLEAILGQTRRRFGRHAVSRFKRLYEDAAMMNILQDTSGRR